VKVKDWRPRQVKTTCGELRYERPWALCRACRQGFSPTDRTLGLAPQQRLSEQLDKWVTWLGGQEAFGPAKHTLAKLTGLELSHETIRGHSEAAGAALAVEQQAAAARVATTGRAATAVRAAPGRLVAETDGVMVRYRDGWHETSSVNLAGVRGRSRPRCAGHCRRARRAGARLGGFTPRPAAAP
jgi:hypothetical protein